MANDACRLCGTDEARLVAVVDGCQYVRCAGCGVERMASYPSAKEIDEFYESGYMTRQFNNLGHHLHFTDGYRIPISPKNPLHSPTSGWTLQT
jgi:hypothetical protein